MALSPTPRKAPIKLTSTRGVRVPSKAIKTRPRSASVTSILLRLLVSINIIHLGYIGWTYKSNLNDVQLRELAECAQPEPLAPRRNLQLWQQLNTEISTEETKKRAIDWLSGAVRIPTETFDNMGEVGQDPRWDVFIPFQEYLQQAFPKVHATLRLTKVNTYGLWYEWSGMDIHLKPIMLAAHQDVVPVENSTIGSWTHAPYSGHYDGKRIWGRGSSDDKAGLIGSLAAAELLIKAGFTPLRTVVFAFGFDEEASGFHGAGHLAKALERHYGEKGIGMVIDEGAGFYDQFGSTIAIPGVAEKGMYNVKLEVRAPGGHSSIPPQHTSIGILAEILSHLESNPPPASLDANQPVYRTLQCVARHAKDLSSVQRTVLQGSLHSRMLMKVLENRVFRDFKFRGIVGTSQAIDVVVGGIKSNALPEDAWATVNHRVSTSSSLGDVQSRYVELLKPLALKHKLAFQAFGAPVIVGDPSRSLIVQNATQHGLEPAPITPTGRNAGPYQLLAGAIKATYNAHRGIPSDGESLIVAPSIMAANTDTRYYWGLTDHIFRYNHYRDLNPVARGVHTVNEHIEGDVFVEMIRFFVTIILNGDESSTL